MKYIKINRKELGKEIRKYFVEDIDFFNDVAFNENVYLFEEEGNIVGILCLRNIDKNAYISHFLISKKYRRNGLGKEIIKYVLTNIIPKDRYTYGYSVSDSVEFWKRLSLEYDKDTYEYIVDNDYDCDALMYFRLK